MFKTPSSCPEVPFKLNIKSYEEWNNIADYFDQHRIGWWERGDNRTTDRNVIRERFFDNGNEVTLYIDERKVLTYTSNRDQYCLEYPNIRNVFFSEEIPLTNEQILKIFLENNNVYGSFKTQYDSLSKAIPVKSILDYGLSWADTIEGRNFWRKKHAEWKDLCEKFKLKGNIKFNNLE